jgi:hypothetical protein
MRLPSNLTEDDILVAVEESTFGLSDIGFCLACGAERYQVEPDARNYPCEECGKRKVFGAQEILLSIVG